ncbi:class I SAM-dependent DNA methyltransferase [Vibrio marisflavi]|uniref:Ubiquinone biosynthesis O-methyltransferase, mitochondrial n=1 Tax=Vibrio marisflavi CECT 7928 TaxID=634439 RepID=A0ABN8DZ46_9VIBR|nr:class I SAM-dependent methyltransferase [Vibrio marisflavi]CAH0537007.1 Ubiquinone biosynthesis O-methyltransferase, mitochondrial [Vibrio marisflavi CECT 7928]
MASEWDDYAEKWELDESTIHFADHAFKALSEVVELTDLEVLDFGCGTGLLSQRLSPLVKNIVALDSSEAMIEQLDKKMLMNVEPVVDMLTRGLVAQHPAFRKQFDLVVASSVCGFLKSFSEVADIIYAILDEGSTFVHFDWLLEDGEQGVGMTQAKTEQVLTSVGFESVSVSVPFEIKTQTGVKKVLMGVAKKA